MWPALALTLLLSPPLQNRNHPGRVHLGNGEWGTPAQAVETGMILLHGQWFPKSLEKNRRKWDKAGHSVAQQPVRAS